MATDQLTRGPLRPTFERQHNRDYFRPARLPKPRRIINDAHGIDHRLRRRPKPPGTIE